ncbi:hypothetical protein JXA34_02530 [Patescibacteria group bacterium]|nr:hypothetical protein [Patescibacteria group bacterium]
MSQGHHGTHDVGTDPAATARFNHLVNSWNVANFSNPEDPNKINRIVCYVVKEGSKIARYVAWHGTRVSSLGTQYGNLNWWQLGEEGWEAYSYDDMNFSRLGLPKDLDPQRFSWENVNCDSMYPPGVSP